MKTLPQVPQMQLRPGHSMSRMIKGGWQLSGDHGPVEASRAIADMIAFYDAGITTFDCADIYSGVEQMLGEFLRVLKKHRGIEAANSVKIHTKYVPDIAQLSSLKKFDVERIVDRSLQRLGLEQLDLVQFHWWDYDIDGFLDAAAYLQQLQDAGKIKHIGVTNFDAQHLDALCHSLEIVSAQVQYSLLDRRPAGKFASIAQMRHVHLLCYGVLAGGFLTDQWHGADDPGFAFENRSLVKYRLIIEEFGGWALFQQLLAVLRQVADRYHVDIDTIAIKSMLDNADVAAVIVGARYAERLPNTLRAFTISFNEQDRQAIDAVLAKAQGPSGPVFGLERDTSGRHGSIMKYNLNSGDDSEMRHRPHKRTPDNDQ